MSHVARNFVYEIPEGAEGRIPKVTAAQIEEYRENIAKYLLEEKGENPHTKRRTHGDKFLHVDTR